jgi:murein DD-endopeptidase MepM/ murein hydrolase activator NlpD
MSRLSSAAFVMALLLLGGGASGLAFSRDGEAPATSPAGADKSGQSTKAEPSEQDPGEPNLELSLLGGSSLTMTLIEAGVGGLDAALADQASLDVRIAPGRPARLWLGSPLPGGARTLERLELPESGGMTVALTRSGEGFALRRFLRQVDETPVRLRLEAERGVEPQLRSAGLPDGHVRQVLSLTSGHRPERVELIAAHTEEAGSSYYGPLLYVAATLPNGQVKRWFGDSGSPLRPLGYGTSVSSGLERPVAGPVTSSVGLRFHPILRHVRWHRGLDFAAPHGAPVRAAEDGRVVDAGWRGGYGQVVRVAHPDGTLTVYAHLSQILTAPGAPVGRGALLGLVGASGLATGPHLHFEWLKDGRPLQPQFGAGATEMRPLDDETIAALGRLLAAPFRAPPSTRLARRQPVDPEALKSPA